MEAAHIAVRGIFSYLSLLLLFRLSGKRIVSECSVFDFVLALIIGDLVDNLVYGKVTAATFVVATGTLIMFEIVSRIVCFTSLKLDHLLEGSPDPLIQNGRPAVDEKRSQLSHLELRSMLRLRGFLTRRWNEIRLSYLESSGRPSVICKENFKLAEKSDLK